MTQMKNIAIYTLTSELHDERAVNAVTQEFLESLSIEYVLKGSDYSDYGTYGLNLIYVRTGGTEGIFRRILPELQAKSSRPFYLLTSGKSNSLAASMEILSYLQQHDIKGINLLSYNDFMHRLYCPVHQCVGTYRDSHQTASRHKTRHHRRAVGLADFQSC